VESKCRLNNARLYTIGIGSGCSESLVKRSAKAGNGRYAFVDDDQSIEAQVIPLLSDSLTPSLS
jgi:hypothetical protein